MKKLLIISCLITVFYSCGVENESKVLTYKNLIILSDLSSRLKYEKPKDIERINQIIDYFRNECVKPGEKIGDKSAIYFSPISEKNMASIDINSFKNLVDKQSFINSTGKFKDIGLDYQIDQFKKTVSKVYKNSRDNGLDLISLLNEKINNEPIIKENTFVSDGIDTTYLNYDNHIYIFTDGYLEYKGKEINSQFYFSTGEINKLRNYSKTNKISITSALEKNPSLGLKPLYNKKNKNITLHILETHERDKVKSTKSYTNISGERENEILESVWRKWAIESGFKSLTWEKY